MTETHYKNHPGHTENNFVECIYWGNTCLTYIIRAAFLPNETTFLTPPEFKQQVGYVVYPAGSEIQRHVHLPLERNIVGTTEVLIIKKGRCQIDIYNDEKNLVTTRELQTGDIMVMVGGGHAFHMFDDTVFLEIKQGPYIGLNEKERF